MKNKQLALITFCIISFSNYYAQARTLGNEYDNFKQWLNNKYNIDYNFTYSILEQRTSPNGKQNALQSYLYPSFTWTNFDNEFGTGSLNSAYNSIFYGGHTALDINNNTGLLTPINDYDEDTQEFVELYYNYKFPNQYKWLNVGLGQYPIYNYDGSQYNANQQINFINYALSQNATSSYSTAGVGVFVQANPNNWSIVIGTQDATNISGQSIKIDNIDEKHYTTFASLSYAPTIPYLGDAQYSFLIYNQPYVIEQPQSTTGWSINISQNIGEKFNIFGRINGVNGNVTNINQSYVAGIIYNNPFNRNSLDQIGLAYAYNKINQDAIGQEIYHNAEQVIEGFWTLGVSKWAILTPDLQFYFNPTLNTKSQYATVSSIRFTIFF